MSKFIPSGSAVNGPDGQGYVTTHDIGFGDIISPDDVVPFGGAPVPVMGELAPQWLIDGLTALMANE